MSTYLSCYLWIWSSVHQISMWIISYNDIGSSVIPRKFAIQRSKILLMWQNFWWGMITRAKPFHLQYLRYLLLLICLYIEGISTCNMKRVDYFCQYHMGYRDKFANENHYFTHKTMDCYSSNIEVQLVFSITWINCIDRSKNINNNNYNNNRSKHIS